MKLYTDEELQECAAPQVVLNNLEIINKYKAAKKEYLKNLDEVNVVVKLDTIEKHKAFEAWMDDWNIPSGGKISLADDEPPHQCRAAIMKTAKAFEQDNNGYIVSDVKYTRCRRSNKIVCEVELQDKV